MKATITELWDTGIDILTVENDEYESISSLADLRKCSNVVIDGTNGEILLNNVSFTVWFRTAIHPSGHGEIRICEIFN